jgi:thiamine kinase-like enzyme
MPIDNKTTQAALEEWPSWGFEHPPRIMGELQQGLNHTVLRLEADSRHYVLKIFCAANPCSIVVQRWAAGYALSPNVVYSAPHGGYFLMDYIEQSELNQATTNIDTKLSKIAATLAKLHSLDSSKLLSGQADFDLFEHCDSYIEDIEGTLRSSMRNKHSVLLPTLERLVTDRTPKTLCHNDLVRENCLFAKHALLLIDWDYAGLNNPWFDLASLIYYLELSDDHAQQLLTLYDPQFGIQVGRPIYWAALCAVVWLDVLWHTSRRSTAETGGPLAGSANIDKKLSDLAKFQENLRG